MLEGFLDTLLNQSKNILRLDMKTWLILFSKELLQATLGIWFLKQIENHSWNKHWEESQFTSTVHYENKIFELSILKM